MKYLVFAALLAFVSSSAFAQTNRTGDVVDGTAVIERLDAIDLPKGQVHRF